MEDIIKRSNVTLDDGKQQIVTNHPILSKEERNFYKLMFGDDLASVRHRRIHCTACDIHIGSAPSKSSNMFAHPILLTLLCAACRNFYGDGKFEQGEDATDMFCRWCANGGNLYCCSYCSNTFCNKCIKRNFDPLVRKKIEDEEKWKCFVCDPSDLYTARAVCWALLKHVQTVTRLLENDRKISKEECKEKMNLDESKCCSRKRNSKGKRRKLSTNGSEDEDETYRPELEDIDLSIRRKISKKSPRIASVTNGAAEKPTPNIKGPAQMKPDIRGFNDEEDDDLPPPMIPCVQYMVEGESSETLNETINKPINVDQAVCQTQPILHINPIPTANLLKAAPPPLLTPIRNNSAKRKKNKSLQHILPAITPKFVVVKNTAAQNPAQNVRTMEYSSLPRRPASRQPNASTASSPSTASPKSPPPRVHTIEYSSLPLRAPSIQPSRYKQTPRIMMPKPKPASTLVKEVGVIEIGSDSDEPDIEESGSKDKRDTSVCKGQDILKYMLNKSSQDNSKFPESCMKKRGDKSYNRVEDEIDLRTEEVRMLFKMIGNKLKKVPMLHLPNHNNLRSTRVKTRRFHLAITKAISTLSDINDKVVHKYSNWRKSMLEESRQTRSNDLNSSETNNDITIPLDMICTNSESDSDNYDDDESDNMIIGDKVKNVKSFQERDTVDVGVGEPILTADKSVQAFDIVERDYEKCIGHSVLTKIEYDPADGSEILKPVIIPAEYNGKFEEQFIFYLQHREENEVETDDDMGLPDPNETPLKDLIEANSPFVLEMLESIDSPLATGMITSELEAEVSDESGKENEAQSEPANVVKEMAKLVTELSEDLKTSRNSDTLSKKHSEHGKKDRRKQVLGNIESEEVDIAVQALIEEDERSRSSSNDDENISHNGKQLNTNDVKKAAALGYCEEDCTIIE